MENPSRPWRDIARELAREPDNNRAWKLSQELDRALEEQAFTQPEAQGPVTPAA
jgi:hypothetical protein